MSVDQIMSKLNFVLYGENMNRINVVQSENESISVELDLHGLRCHEAERTLRNVININKNLGFNLVVIHGFNHGVALKKMIRNAKLGDRVMCLSSPNWNPGRTNITVAA